MLAARLFVLSGVEGVRPFLLFLAPIALGAWFGGWRPGLVATAGGALVVSFFFLPPPLALAWPGGTAGIHTLAFLGQGAFLSVMLEARLRSLERSHAHGEVLRRLTSELTLSEERERRRIAHGLHDHLQQLLLASRMKMTLVRKQGEPGPVRTAADEADALLAEAIEFTRNLTADVCPPVLGDLGLRAGLEWTAAEFGRRFGLRVDVRGEGEAEPQGEDVRVLLFHCVRELLFNVAKHAGTSHATVSMACGDGVLRLTVEDRGVGYDPAAVARRDDGGGRFGLFSVRERLAALGGRMETVTAPGQGVRTTLVAPVAAPARDETPTPALDANGGLRPAFLIKPGRR
jgi:signal transduction histidine kinase